MDSKYRPKFTFESMRELCKQYNSPHELRVNDESAHHIANKNKWLYQIFEKEDAEEKERLLVEDLKKTALKYKSVNEFRENDYNKYEAIKRRNLVDKFCSHMIRQKNSRGQEIARIIFDKILNEKGITNCKKILSDRKEIDIFYPKYKIGIEYDGCYWHGINNSLERDLAKNKECENLGILLIRILEPATVYANINSVINLVKENIINNLDLLNDRLFSHIEDKDISDIVVSMDEIFSNLYGMEDIEKAIDSCTTRREFSKKYGKYYQYLRINKNLHLLNKLKRLRCTLHQQLSSQEFIYYIYFKYTKYNDFYRNESLYRYGNRHRLLSEIRKLFRSRQEG